MKSKWEQFVFAWFGNTSNLARWNLFQSSKEMARATDDNARLRHIKNCNLYKGQYKGCREYDTGKRRTNN